MKKSESMRIVVPWLGFALLGLAACQVVVGETELTTVHCKDEGAVGPPACAAGQTCLNGVCISGAASDGGAGTGGTGGTGGVDGGTSGGGTDGGGTGGTAGTAGDPDAGDASDTGFDAPDDGVPDVAPDVPIDTPVDVAPDVAPLLSVGAACATDDQCQSNRCYLGPNGKRCTSLCCSSFECAGGTVCVPYSGLNVCFPPGDVGIAAIGTLPQGQDCGDGAQCRSGRCSTSAKCFDVCCTNGNCNDNAACALQNYGGVWSWFCASHLVGSSKPHYEECASDTECDGRNCYDYSANARCMGPCCSDADCESGIISGHCDYLSENGTATRQCFPSILSPPGDLKACCSDANCPSGQHCVPTEDDAWNTNTLPPYTNKVWGMRCQ